MGIIQEIEEAQKKKKVAEVKVGDTVKVFSKIIEGSKERTQGFEGIIIKKAGHGVRKNLTVRKIVQGIGVERTFILHSPKVERIELIRSGKVRRAKLYYLRKRIGSRATRVDEGTAASVTEEAGESAAA